MTCAFTPIAGIRTETGTERLIAFGPCRAAATARALPVAPKAEAGGTGGGDQGGGACPLRPTTSSPTPTRTTAKLAGPVSLRTGSHPP
jgi:hypothetical protein